MAKPVKEPSIDEVVERARGSAVEILAQFTGDELQELGDRFDSCTHGRKLRCDDCACRDWDAGRKEGFQNGFDWVMNKLKEYAGAAFVRGADSEARSLREITILLTDMAAKEKLIPVVRQR